jgi:folate-binding protein YgfZ
MAPDLNRERGRSAARQAPSRKRTPHNSIECPSIAMPRLAADCAHVRRLARPAQGFHRRAWLAGEEPAPYLPGSIQAFGEPMKTALLPDRGVLRLSGPEAKSFLNGLITADVATLAPGEARFAALLTPQGKIVADFFVLGAEEGLWLDVPKELADALAKKLGFYKLRAKVTVENLADTHEVAAIWDGTPFPREGLFADPRDPRLGFRAIVPRGTIQPDDSDYEAHRIPLGAPQGGSDFAYGDAFPHETNMDRIHGVDFGKGCYIGQEVVSRMQHRGTARTRMVRITFEGAAPPQGAAIVAGEKPVGTMGSSAGGQGLAMLRLNRAAEARVANTPLIADGIVVRVADIADLSLPEKRSVA